MLSQSLFVKEGEILTQYSCLRRVTGNGPHWIGNDESRSERLFRIRETRGHG